MDKHELFLNDLTELSKKYGIYIDGCGCCDSPFLVEDHEPQYQNGELSWNKESKKYE